MCKGDQRAVPGQRRPRDAGGFPRQRRSMGDSRSEHCVGSGTKRGASPPQPAAAHPRRRLSVTGAQL